MHVMAGPLLLSCKETGCRPCTQIFSDDDEPHVDEERHVDVEVDFTC